MRKLTLAFLSLLSLLLASAAHAYIGPGLGAGAIAMILGVIGSSLLALFVVLYYPIKRMMKKRKSESQKDEGEKRS